VIHFVLNGHENWTIYHHQGGKDCDIAINESYCGAICIAQ
jgi:hypothetical protein